jgi:uncharacterized membrane protein HdeD (DUF308 family)
MQRLDDLRFIIGLFFTFTGGLLVLLAFLTESEKTFGSPLNLYSGMLMLLFGLVMAWFGKGDE